LSGSIKVVITEEFLNKVKYLCSKINDKEWSGMLFYDINGTIKDIPNMVIIPREIFLRDIGVKAHTEFDYDEECMEFVESNNLFMSKHGLIHSHNSMSVFFSGEDQDELQENAINHNVYLSLVVNNFMNMVAKVVFIGKTPSKFTCPDEDGNEYELEIAEPEKVMFVYDCKMDFPRQEFTVSEEFKKIFSKVRKKTAEKNKLAQEAAKQQSLNKSVHQHAGGASGYNSWGKSEGYGGQQNFNLGSQSSFDFRNRLEAIEDIEPEDDEEGLYDDFFCYCLNGGAHTQLELEAIIEDIDSEQSGDIIVDQVISNYATYYQNYYETDQFGTDESDFRNCLNQFIPMCDLLAQDSPWLTLLGTGLRLIYSKFEELNLNKHDTNDTEV
jgi:proteasome lid subunit RPN8/RPN11